MKVRVVRKLGEDSGSALIEFVVLGLVAQLLVLGVGVGLLEHQQHQLAAISAANLLGRSLAAGGAVDLDADGVAAQVADNFSLEPRDVQFNVSAPGSFRIITAMVVDATYSYRVRQPR